MDTARHSILVVDDDDSVRVALRRTLRIDGYEIVEAASGEEGLEILGQRAIDLVISDQTMPGMSGEEFLAAARKSRPDGLRFILTGHADAETAARLAKDEAIYRALVKPWDQAELRVTLRLGLRHLEVLRANAKLLEIARAQASLLGRLKAERPDLQSWGAATIASEEELARLASG